MQLKEFVERWHLTEQEVTDLLGQRPGASASKFLSLVDALWFRWEQEDESIHIQKLRAFYLEISARSLADTPEVDAPNYEQYLRFRQEQSGLAFYSVDHFINYWKLTREEFADLIGKSLNTLNRWLSEKASQGPGGQPGSDVMKSLAAHHLILLNWQDEDQNLLTRNLRELYNIVRDR